MADKTPRESRRGFAYFLRLSFAALLVAGVIAAAVLMLFAPTLGLGYAEIEQAIEASGPWGAVLSVLLMVAHSFVPFPAELVAIANGMLFGVFWGVVLTWVGAMLGAVLAFWLARLLGRPFVSAIVARRHWSAIDEWTEKEGWRVLLLARLIPVIAFNLINYAAGLTRISLWTFLWTTGLGILPATVAMVVMGDQMEVMPWEVWLVLGVVAIGLWFVWRRKFRLPPNDASDR